MTTTEPRVLITAIKCGECQRNLRTFVAPDGWLRLVPSAVDAKSARHGAANWRCGPCGGGRLLIATEPVPTSHLVGDFEWMHSLGFDDLDNEEGSDGTEIPHFGGEAQPQVRASQGAAGASNACARCGQLAFGEHGRCACQEVSDE